MLVSADSLCVMSSSNVDAPSGVDGSFLPSYVVYFFNLVKKGLIQKK